ncbi:hypothetical protein PPERSA_03964 [Pseudocohnilembus persalinus]|uniref:Uncharacterized protein n=1 Tax=Pseudocohnilembus persalinus TaxID=266149 RepID=A0A0V0QAT1_PSEPJ|nr:hypothetical protein PPERSA_03964 [Pseudocohnilembus persalinus]|eukprot:KRW99258.1 hypothetical protein PPERSA_03964 [Pseudocohnilembus persalinus]
MESFKEINTAQYNKNRNHKVKALKFANYQVNFKGYKKDISNFNFKKTNGRKYFFSCSGYGGKCPSCKYGCYRNDNIKNNKKAVLQLDINLNNQMSGRFRRISKMSSGFNESQIINY